MNYIGFRYWRAFAGPPLVLRALVMDVDWSLSGPTIGRHHSWGSRTASQHPAPIPGCTCGLHAWRRLPDALVGDWGQGTVGAYATEGATLVAGAVLTGGRVCLHGDEGLRAEQALPVAFGIHDRLSTPPVVRDLAINFGVPIFDFEHLEKYSLEFGDRFPQS